MAVVHFTGPCLLQLGAGEAVVYAEASLSLLAGHPSTSSGSARPESVLIERIGVDAVVSELFSVRDANRLADDAETSTWSFSRSLMDEIIVVVSGSTLHALKAFVASSSSSSTNPSLAIDPAHFYGTSGSSSSSTSGPAQPSADEGGQPVFRVFSRQQHAFDHCDALLRADPTAAAALQLKVFSFETVTTGQRRFLVASYAEFFRQYYGYHASSVPPAHPPRPRPTHAHDSEPRHVYEIIRERHPCRAYFDLEYQKTHNPTVDGDVLTAVWIHLVAWKLAALFGLDDIGPEHFTVLDSSTATKFSKHVVVVLPARGGNAAGEGPAREVLFRDNAAVGAFVDLILRDITAAAADEDTPCGGDGDGDGDGDGESPTSLTNPPAPVYAQRGLRPLPAYEHLWVWKEDGKKTLFVDLGVYTRNRMFRIYHSSKYGKNVPLTLTFRDRKAYRALSRTPEEAACTNVRELQHRTLLRSLVVPVDVYARVGPAALAAALAVAFGEGGAAGEGSGECKDAPPCPGHPPPALGAPGAAVAAAAGPGAAFDISPDAGPFLRLPPAPRGPIWTSGAGPGPGPGGCGTSSGLGGGGGGGAWRHQNVLSSRHPSEPSPFPAVDRFVRACASTGGVPGDLASWTLYTAMNGTSYRLQYQIARNRWCGHVGRAHKSNGVMYEADLTFRCVTQRCWDPDCRGYRSEPIPLPPWCTAHAAGTDGAAAAEVAVAVAGQNAPFTMDTSLHDQCELIAKQRSERAVT